MRTRWVGKTCGAALVAAALVLVALATASGSSAPSLGVVAAMLPWVLVGAFIVATETRNPIGWLFATVGLLWLLGEVAYDWALTASDPSSLLLRYASWYSDSYWIPGLGLLLIAVMLFPTGRLPSRAWRPVFVLALMGLLLAFGRTALAESVQAGDDGLVVDNPIGLEAIGFVATGDEIPILLCLFAVALTAVVCFIVRFRRSRGVERQQLKWMALAVPAMVAGWVLAGFAEPWPLASEVIRFGSIVLVPIAAGFAITRFHLYDVDQVISRTTAYALVTGVLLVVYVAVVASLTTLIPTSDSTGEPESWVVGVATLAAATAFRPVLRWAQTLVDRRFNREQYDAQRAVQSFADQLRDAVDPREVVDELLSVVDRTVAPTDVRLWIRDGER